MSWNCSLTVAFAAGSGRRFSGSTATTSNGTVQSNSFGPSGTPLRSGSASALRTTSTSSSNSAGYHTCGVSIRSPVGVTLYPGQV